MGGWVGGWVDAWLTCQQTLGGAHGVYVHVQQASRRLASTCVRLQTMHTSVNGHAGTPRASHTSPVQRW